MHAIQEVPRVLPVQRQTEAANSVQTGVAVPVLQAGQTLQGLKGARSEEPIQKESPSLSPS